MLQGLFESFLKSFYIVSSDPTHIKMLKVRILHFATKIVCTRILCLVCGVLWPLCLFVCVRVCVCMNVCDHSYICVWVRTASHVNICVILYLVWYVSLVGDFIEFGK